MANILRGYGLAREQGYFKVEQVRAESRNVWNVRVASRACQTQSTPALRTRQLGFWGRATHSNHLPTCCLPPIRLPAVLLPQEADVQRLMKEGKLPAEGEASKEGAEGAAAAGEAGAAQGPRQRFEDSEHTYDTLAEVLQQRVRLDDPHALRRKQFDRRVKGEAPPLSEAEMLRARWVGGWVGGWSGVAATAGGGATAADSNALGTRSLCSLLLSPTSLPPSCLPRRSKMYALTGAVGHVPRMSMGRDRFTLPQGADDLALSLRQLSPEAREVASRTYVAGRADACWACWACWACLACLDASRAAGLQPPASHDSSMPTHPPSCLSAQPCCPVPSPLPLQVCAR